MRLFFGNVHRLGQRVRAWWKWRRATVICASHVEGKW
jgi:hypothetical protein